MWKLINKFLTLPFFASPEEISLQANFQLVNELERRKSFLTYINYSLLIMGAAAVIASTAFPETAAYTITAALASFFTFFLVLYLIKINKVKWGGFLFSGLIAFTFYFQLWQAMAEPVQDVMNNSIVMMMMGVPIIFAGITIGRWSAIGVTFLNLIVQLVLIQSFGAASIPTFSVNLYWWILALAIWLYETTLRKALGNLYVFQMHLEDLVEERTQSLQNTVEALESSKRSLEVSNKELDSFSYSISHDLRAPLRGMDGFSKILQDEFASELNETALHYLDRIRDNAQKMNQLIEDLLAFSRLGRQEIQVESVDPTSLARSIVDSFVHRTDRRDMKVSIGNLPVCKADPALLRQVYTNLLDNAFKYTRTCEDARIEVGWQGDVEEPVYFVRDNGVGFDMQYADKIFGVFQRLHTSETFEGTGVGLAIVQRILHRHGGQIWAEAEEEAGASFYFKLPG